MTTNYQPIRPDEKLEYSFDWTDWLSGSPVETISSRIWTINPTGPTLADETTAVVTVSGCEFGKTYRLQEKITTDLNQDGVRAITLRGVL